MKRAAPSSSSSSIPASKRSAVQNVNKGFTADSIPPHHYPLGEGNYAAVSDFNDCVNVHLRKFRMNENGLLFATKEGVSFSPFVWKSLQSIMNNSSLPSDAGNVQVVKDTLFLTTVFIENSPHVTLQRYVTKDNFSRHFLPSVCILTEVEWDRLQTVSQKISESCKTLMYNVLLKKKLLSEASSRSVQSSSPMELTDAQDLLSVSLTETLTQHLSQRITDVFHCDGCLQNQANQLGHDCVTMDLESRFELYGELAALSIDIDILVKDFIDKNVHILNYVDNSFLNKLSFDILLKNAGKMYMSSDPLPN